MLIDPVYETRCSVSKLLIYRFIGFWNENSLTILLPTRVAIVVRYLLSSPKPVSLETNSAVLSFLSLCPHAVCDSLPTDRFVHLGVVFVSASVDLNVLGPSCSFEGKRTEQEREGGRGRLRGPLHPRIARRFCAEFDQTIAATERAARTRPCLNPDCKK